jgi:hypothetical protein
MRCAELRRTRASCATRAQAALPMVKSTLEPLKTLPFVLSLDYEITRWDL